MEKYYAPEYVSTEYCTCRVYCTSIDIVYLYDYSVYEQL